MSKPQYLVIPAAGYGTRMKPVNDDLPKEMLPVGDKPAILYCLEEAVSARIDQVVIIINHKKEILRHYLENLDFAKSLYPGTVEELKRIQGKCSMHFLYQKNPWGEADALGLAEDIVVNKSLAVMYPDNLYFPGPGILSQMSKIFGQKEFDIIALSKVNKVNSHAFANSGRVDLSRLDKDLYSIKKFYDKGPGSFVPRWDNELRTCGISINGPHLFDYIKRARQKDLQNEFTDGPVRSLILQERTILGLKLNGNIYDIGFPLGYEFCCNQIQTFKT
jgi:UTP--glucose-1-phosphate uridylyltransferase